MTGSGYILTRYKLNGDDLSDRKVRCGGRALLPAELRGSVVPGIGQVVCSLDTDWLLRSSGPLRVQ